jgi:hypothetical protein
MINRAFGSEQELRKKRFALRFLDLYMQLSLRDLPFAWSVAYEVLTSLQEEELQKLILKLERYLSSFRGQR